jgi:hypothetical protein
LRGGSKLKLDVLDLKISITFFTFYQPTSWYTYKHYYLIAIHNVNHLEKYKTLYTDLLFGYSDAAYITDGNAKSRLGGCAFMGLDAGAVLSFSRNDSIMSSLSHSSTEAEIKAVDELMREMSRNSQ